MAERSAIEWTEASWTPIRARRGGIPGSSPGTRIGWHCAHVSEGCRNCYAERINRRLGTGLDYKPGLLSAGKLEVFLDEKTLTAPLRWRRPRRIFVCSMTDVFAEFVEDAWIDRVFAVMALSPQHTYQVLTKRSARMRDYLEPRATLLRIDRLLRAHAEQQDRLAELRGTFVWPLPHVWLGVSAEDQDNAETRIPDLLQTPARLRFVSAEPLLGPLDLTRLARRLGEVTHRIDALRGLETIDHPVFGGGGASRAALDWIIVGGESGPRARPMHPDWARDLRDQCVSAGVPFFFKQWGEWRPWLDPGDARDPRPPYRNEHFWPDGSTALRFGKRLNGRLLDGREWNELPEARA